MSPELLTNRTTELFNESLPLWSEPSYPTGMTRDPTIVPNAAGGSFWTFLGRFLRDPRRVGAVVPSSRYLARKMVHAIEWTSSTHVVEFGPGTGPFTAEIFARLPEGADYLGIEREAAFVDILRQRLPQADLVCDSVTRLVEILESRDLLPVDHIVSGLPFASFPRDLTGEILEQVSGALRPGGTFTTFQYVHACGLSSARHFRGQMNRRFGPMDSWKLELRNIPPAFVFTWRMPLSELRA